MKKWRLPVTIAGSLLLLSAGLLLGCGVVPMKVELYATPRIGPAPIAVLLQMHVNPFYDPESYKWNFGDGSSLVISSSNKISHTYQQPGSYTASCYAYQSVGTTLISAGDTIAVHVTAPSDALQLTISADPMEACGTGDSVEVLFDSTVTGGDSPYDYYWFFGDGSYASGVANPSHLYDNVPGIYLAQFYVIDADGRERSSDVLEIVICGGVQPARLIP